MGHCKTDNITLVENDDTYNTLLYIIS